MQTQGSADSTPVADDQKLIDAMRRRGAMMPAGTSDSHPIHFGDPRGEDESALTDAALFDLSDRSHLELTGADRAKFLHNFCTNNVLSLKAGQGCEAFVTNVKGRVLSHIYVFAGEESIRVESVPGAEPGLLAHLDRYLITEDVQIIGRTGDWGELYVSGPRSAERLRDFGIEVAHLALCEHELTRWNDVPIHVRRVDLLGWPGCALVVPRGDLAALWEGAGRAGIRPAGSATFEAQRIEAGTPRYGMDITEDNLAQEVGRTRQAISFTKGCYLGQEPIARIDALGHVNQELRGLMLESSEVPPVGSPVLAASSDEAAGRVTSSAFSHHRGRAVALAYLRTRHVKPGSAVRVSVRGEDTGGQAASGPRPDELVPATVFWPE